MCRWVLVWALSSLVVAIPEEHQYCAVRYRRLCQGKGRHVACQFPDIGPGSSCEHYTPIKFTNDLKHFITHYLNRRRQRIAAGNERVRGGVHLPKPQIMMLVEWDRELALLAQRLADQCHFVHDDCRATVRYPYAGQTVGEVRWRRFSDSDELSAQRAIRRVLDAWWGERRRVQPKQLTAPFRLTSKGAVWGHFSQLAVWNLQAVGCGAVRHGAHHPRLLLVCDFSHTNMLGQRTLVSGPMIPCPIHTTRRPRTAYPLLCAPVRHPVPTEPEEKEMEDNFEEDEEEDGDIATIEVGEASTPSLWFKRKESRRRTDSRERTDNRESGDHRERIENDERVDNSDLSLLVDGRLQKSRMKSKYSTIRPFPDNTRKIDTKLFRGPSKSSSTNRKESVIQKLDREQEQKTRNNMNPNVLRPQYKEAHNTFDSHQFEDIVQNDWRIRKKPNFGQWRQNQENPENLEEVIPLSVPQRQQTYTVEPTIAEMYRPTIREEKTDHVSRISVVVYRPTAGEDGAEHDENSFHQRWRQSRVRPQRPGANALLYTATSKYSKKEFIASLNLDKDDTDQLFRDTGFNVHWRKRTT